MKKNNKRSLKRRNKRNTLKIRKRYSKQKNTIRKKNKRIRRKKNKTLKNKKSLKNFKGGAIPFSEMRLIPQSFGHKLGGMINSLSPTEVPALNNPIKMDANNPDPTKQFIRTGGTTQYTPVNIDSLYSTYYPS